MVSVTAILNVAAALAISTFNLTSRSTASAFLRRGRFAGSVHTFTLAFVRSARESLFAE